MCVYYRWELERKMNKKKGRGTDRKQIVHIVDCGCELSQLSVLRKILTPGDFIEETQHGAEGFTL